MRRSVCMVIALVLMAWLHPALAEDKRVALVIGNAAYQNAPKLKNPVNDAKAIAAALTRLHFKVIIGTDLDQAGMVAKLRDFRKESQGADIALVFYSGHGLQVAGQNWLLPVTAKLESEHDLDYEAVKVDAVLNEAEGTKRLRLILLDACRDNPFKTKLAQGTRSGSLSRGLARVEPSGTDTLIAYATKADDVAQDGEGADSPFTTAFIKHVDTAGLDVRLLFGRVRDEVRAATGGKQEPAIYGSLGGDEIYLKALEPGAAKAAPPAPSASAAASAPPQAPSAPPDHMAADVALWNSAEKLNTAEAYQEYKSKFPDGKFAGMADLRIKDLSEKDAADKDGGTRNRSGGKPQQMASSTALLMGGDAPASGVGAGSAGSGNLLGGCTDCTNVVAAPAIIGVKVAGGVPVAGVTTPFAMAGLGTRTSQEPAKPPEGFRDCPECPEMVVIPPGSFTMGSPPAETAREGVPESQSGRERPQHQVTLSHAFALGRYPVTRDEFAAFQKETGYEARGCTILDGKQWREDAAKNWRNPGFEQTGRDPAICLAQKDAQAYISWLNQRLGGKAYRLPSEAEWEYAARAGTQTAHYWGDGREAACEYADAGDLTTAETLGWDKSAQFPCRDGHTYTAPVGSYKPNAFGLYDMLGNAWQWTADCWTEDYSNAPTDGRAATAGDCTKPALRGGSWFNAAASVRSAQRYKSDAATRNYAFGFRLAKTLP